ncbi:hypothetical protein OSB04_030312 [Centaurea solstitialis]|uniref:Uncharacterized protein n=1 Tax=Centaurea solstitialis TaxID=347529 RepID=A0AA38S8J3_9ASTR|nr:hypothetical protein OSB04_030312 [Centaurea solstitialis]
MAIISSYGYGSFKGYFERVQCLAHRFMNRKKCQRSTKRSFRSEEMPKRLLSKGILVNKGKTFTSFQFMDSGSAMCSEIITTRVPTDMVSRSCLKQVRIRELCLVHRLFTHLNRGAVRIQLRLARGCS